MTEHTLYELIDRLGNLLKAESRRLGSKYGLLPVHIQILDYLQRCNKYSNNPLGVSKYLGITKGTVSQSLKILERKGLIFKVVYTDDKRSVRLRLTSKGSKVLEKIISDSLLTEIFNIYTHDSVYNITSGLKNILVSLQKNNKSRTFGICNSCRHLLIEKNKKFRCGLTKEPLTTEDTKLICHEHEYPDAAIL